MAVSEASFWEHISELRKTILLSLMAIAAGVLLCFCFYQQIFEVLLIPLQKSQEHSNKPSIIKRFEIKSERILNSGTENIHYHLPNSASTPIHLSPGVQQMNNSHFQLAPGAYLDVNNIVSNNGLIIFGPTEGMSTTLKICFWIGFVISSPAWLFFIFKFIAPALHERERRLILPFLSLSALFLSIGVFFAYSVTLPLANRYLESFNSTLGTNLWSLSNYMDYTLFLFLANALAFELSLILFFLVHFGVLSAETLASKRRHMIVLAFIIGALLTPPDILTQMMLALPLILLYEITIIYAHFKSKYIKNKPIIS